MFPEDIQMGKKLCLYWPVLRGGDEECSQLAQDVHAGVDEEAAQDGQRQQTGRGSAVVQLSTGASFPHHDGQQSHQNNVTEQELQVSQVRLHLNTHVEKSHVSLKAIQGEGGEVQSAPQLLTV